MRQARIKVDAERGEAVYHVMTRTVNGERLLDDVAKEVLRKQLWQVADFCGVDILTFALMANHFHVLVRIPKKSEVSDEEVLRRWRVLNPKPSKYQAIEFEAVKKQLLAGEAEARAWRDRQLTRMGDVSLFMKLLKQRFTLWFNRTHGRFGTLWAERFKSVLVENKRGALSTMAAYIDLNPVRAGLVDDPKDYRFCGYAEALVRNTRARRGLQAVTGARGDVALAHYRQLLFGKGSIVKSGSGSLDVQQLQEVANNEGKLGQAVVLRCRLRHFTDGAVLGSQAFVREHLERYRAATGRRRKSQPRDLPPLADWGGLTTLRGRRLMAFD